MFIYRIIVKDQNNPLYDREFILTRECQKEEALLWVAFRYPNNEIVIDEIREPSAPAPMFN